ncbi:alpha-mannosidase [Marinigracilibium pacificum]|uniref:Alpha-mannosidase n=1 Tax=Marinigracilibium pacificum TaxID=2729599 RepID=A0A848IYX5_9BACT|nr:glycoside hydrolase family 38 C-terminal domain-containing protein [Marinigracilibium pacificum]NMM48358.1 alpha-mannosidase [Marinigracilibium pacificum]
MGFIYFKLLRMIAINYLRLFVFVGCFSITILCSAQDGMEFTDPQTIEYIKKAAEGDHLALEGGHLALDGHVMPYMFFEPHEIMYLFRLSQIRHEVIWKADSIYFSDSWEDDFPEKIPKSKDVIKVPSSHKFGKRHTESTIWFNLPAINLTSEREKFLCIKPLDMSLVGWPETTIFIDNQPKAALLRQHFYWSFDQIKKDSEPKLVCLKSFGVFDKPRGYREISVVERNPIIDELYWRVRVLIEALSILPEDSSGYQPISSAVKKVMNTLDLNLSSATSFQSQAEITLDNLRKDFLEIEKVAKNNPVLSVLIHGHLDSAWRWTLTQTDEKIQRLVLNNLYLMDRYPQLRYVFTSPYHYERLKKLYPKLYDRVLEKIKSGQWIANGATYLEGDLNLPGGESVIRQFLYGLAFYENELGVTENALFLPDTFGYPAFFPQIVKQFGLDHLIAMRVNTPEIDRTIYDWKGVDGSSILVFGLSTPAWEYPYIYEMHRGAGKKGYLRTTYNAPDPGPRRSFGTWQQFKNKDITDNQLMLIGWGDGGGGATEDHLELMHYGASLPGIPKLEWTNLVDYVNSQKSVSDNYPGFSHKIMPEKWIQKTFMMASGLKVANRMVESQLKECEALCSFASLHGFEYPAEELRALWKKLLIQHFHDIITGQGVPEVLMKAKQDLDSISLSVDIISTDAMNFIAEKLTMKSDGLLLFNSSGVNFNGVIDLGNIDLKGKSLVDEGDKEIEFTYSDEGNLLLKANDLKPFTFIKYYLSDNTSSIQTGVNVSANEIENQFLILKINDQGEIISLFDKELKKELVSSGRKFNVFYKVDYKNDKRELITLDSKFINAFQNDLTGGLTFEKSIGDSRIVQKIILEKGSREIKFDSYVDWKEEYRLGVDFPINNINKMGTYGLQFGFDSLSTAISNPNDSLFIPFAAYQWVNISGENYGYSLLDNGRYAYDIKGGGVFLNLAYGLRKHNYQELADVEWNQKASGDIGGENFTYSFMPHSADFVKSKIINKARALNSITRARLIPENSNDDIDPYLILSESDDIIIESIKMAEDGEGIIVRMSEKNKEKATVKLKLNRRFTSASLNKINESENQKINITNSEIELNFNPFEIKTIRLTY